MLKWVGRGCIALLVFWIITTPTAAADKTRSVGDRADKAAHSFTTFLTEVTK